MILSKKDRITRLSRLGMLAALVVVLQLVGTLLTGFTGLPMSFVLIPIVVGAVILGPTEGAILGFLFGVITMVMGLTGLDAFTSIIMYNFGVWKMIVVIVLCLAKAALAGYGAGWIYKLCNKIFKGKNDILSLIFASVSAPIINTGIFVVGMLLFFFNDMGSIQAYLNIPAESIVGSTKFIFLVLAGWNFVSEFAINLIISPAVLKIVKKIIH